MKNKYTLAIILLSLFCNSAIAQTTNEEETTELTLDELSSPNLPAFTILGLNPTEVNKPTTARALALSFANSFENKGLASDLALEFTPFWFAKHSNMTFNDYFYKPALDTMRFGHFIKSVGNNIKQTSSFSFATSAVKDDSLGARNVSGGLRFQLLAGKPTDEFLEMHNLIKENDEEDWILEQMQEDNISSLKQLYHSIDSLAKLRVSINLSYKKLPEDKQKEVSTRIAKRIRKNISKQLKENDDVTAEDIASELKRLLEHSDEIQKENIKKLQDKAISSRRGWIWEMAAASSLLLPTNDLEYSFGNDWAIWTTLTYRSNNQKNDFSIMARRTGNFQNTSTTNTDAGLSYIFSGKKFSITFEGILRNYTNQFMIQATTGESYLITKSNYTNKFAFSAQYKLMDYINISASVGKDYDNTYTTNGNLFTLINLNMILPQKQTVSAN
ncbi:MAG: hypothetical protein J0L87_12500 [Bacteroidetes bacterium]|nr:hypothetical protein [Bacteroidota bacterium]